MLHLEALAEAPSLTPKQLATKHGDEAARWALLQLALRKRAIKKFGDLASQMLYEREALEQATSLAVARYHASQFPQGAPVIDLTAGLGGDAIALAERGPVTAYENDPIRAELLEFNLTCNTVVPAQIAQVRIEDGMGELLLGSRAHPGYIWADPDRRSDTGRRLTKPEDYTPNPADLATKLKDCKLAGIKLSPLLPDDYLESLGGSLEFISHHGECLEAIIWLGTENDKPKRQAVVLRPNLKPITIEATPDSPIQAPNPKSYIHDCDPAVVRAHCLATFGHQHLGDSPGYLTSDDPTPNPAYNTYRVLECASPKQIKEKLRKINGRAYELKQRGTGIDSAKLLKSVQTEDGRPISVVAFQVAKSIRFVLTERLG